MEEGAGRTFVQREATGKASGGCVAIRKRSPSFVTGNQLAGWVASDCACAVSPAGNPRGVICIKMADVVEMEEESLSESPAAAAKRRAREARKRKLLENSKNRLDRIRK